MKTLLLSALLLYPTGGQTQKDQPRQPHPLAPSLPLLTQKEYDAQLDIVNRFILQDTGKLKGDAAAKAVADFKALGPEATFALLAGLNKAANMEDSCPAVLIAKKLNLIIASTKDVELLDFLKENIGGGVTAKRHTLVLKDLKTSCTLRKATVQRTGIAAKPAAKDKTLQSMTLPELIAAANKAQGEPLKNILTEIATRKSDQVITVLATAAAMDDKEIQPLARGLLVEALSDQSAKDLQQWLAKGSPAVRIAAATAIGDKGYRLTDALITALADNDEALRQAARQALVKLAANAVDYGPAAGAETRERTEAQEQWRFYWQAKK
ncbi:MAG TPA: HEAT repeat domain-containing protein [Gemmataceae bacterium]|nr:HEAT repeat domain-containing protein [Gemmataceae bacterium]